MNLSNNPKESLKDHSDNNIDEDDDDVHDTGDNNNNPSPSDITTTTDHHGIRNDQEVIDVRIEDNDDDVKQIPTNPFTDTEKEEDKDERIDLNVLSDFHPSNIAIGKNHDDDDLPMTISDINNNSNRHMMMSRQSTVSSMAGNSMDLGDDHRIDRDHHHCHRMIPNNDDNILLLQVDADDLLLSKDNIQLDQVTNELGLCSNNSTNMNDIPSHILQCGDSSVKTMMTTTVINSMDERSIRSDRPDPPPSSEITTRRTTITTSVEQHPHQNHHHYHHHHEMETTATTHIKPNESIMAPQQQQQQQQQHRHVTTAEENFAVEALASLSMNMAEMTLSEETQINAQQQQQQQQPPLQINPNSSVTTTTNTMNTEWDLNRTALLAETPDGVTIRKTTSLHSMTNTPTVNGYVKEMEMEDQFHMDHMPTISYRQRSLSVPQIHNNTNNNGILPSTNDVTSSYVVGPDHLMVLPRVDEGNRVSYHNMNHLPLSHSSYHHPSLQQPNPTDNNLPPPPPPSSSSNLPHSNMSKISYNNNNNNFHGDRKTVSGRRKIRLRLQEEVRITHLPMKKRHTRSTSLLGTIRNSSTRMLRFGVGGRGVGSWENDDHFDTNVTSSSSSTLGTNLYTIVDRGHLMIGWFDGTSTFELQQHIHKSVLRKVQQLFTVVGDNNNQNNNGTSNDTIVDIEDLRILDESFDPPEDVVLSPYIPDGSQFLLRFSTIKAGKTKKNGTRMKTDYVDGTMTPMSVYSGRAPDSPSAAPSPHLDKHLLNGLNANQIALLNSLNIPTERPMNRRSSSTTKNIVDEEPKQFSRRTSTMSTTDKNTSKELTDMNQGNDNNDEGVNDEHSKRIDSNGGQLLSEMSSDEDDNADDATMMLHSDDPIEARLREITNLLLIDRKKERYRRYDRQREKRQVIFVVANYFVLFLAIIAISAELQARAPHWIKMMEVHLQNVQNCSENHEALFECVSRGDFAGLIASVVLWLSRSVTTKRIFLFGFDTPKKLWTVVYESLVTSVCWGISYLFIRRGMNPDTRPRFVQKYWKDAVYGSLAGFNAAFLKHILKNLIPEQVVEDALRERQLKIMGWLPSFNFR